MLQALKSIKSLNKGRKTKIKPLKLKPLVYGLFSIVLLINLCIFLAPFVEISSTFEIITLFYPFFVLVMVFITGTMAMGMARIWPLATILMIIQILALVGTYLLPIKDNIGSSSPVITEAPNLRVITLNALKSNSSQNSQSLMHRWIYQEKPDLIAIQEAPFSWVALYAAIKADYPYLATPIGQYHKDINLLSRFPIISTNRVRLGQGKLELVSVVVETPKGYVNIIIVHPMTIRSDAQWRERNFYMNYLTKVTDFGLSDTIVLGDFNASPWSKVYRDLLQQRQLSDHSEIFPQFTRILDKSQGFSLGARIDNVAVSAGSHVKNCTIGPDVGSDHLPVMCDLQMVFSGR
jgi:endonuclease/exonuclease/phosphatase (EEP) superfamily protein YafD